MIGSIFGQSDERGEPKAFKEFLAKNENSFSAEEFVDLESRSGKGKAFILRRTT